jgi:hypothetical protein
LWGIITASGSGNKVYNNLIYNLTLPGDGNAGIHVFSGSKTELYNNTVYGLATAGIIVSGASSTIVINNLAYANAGGDFMNSGSDTTTANNLFGTDPMFVNAGAGTFRLQRGSPAIGAGATIALVTTDIIGTPRPQDRAYTIGAYEFGPPPPTGFRIIKD